MRDRIFGQVTLGSFLCDLVRRCGVNRYLVVGGADSVMIARLDPEGTNLLYLLQPSPEDTSGTGRLMSVPRRGPSRVASLGEAYS